MSSPLHTKLTEQFSPPLVNPTVTVAVVAPISEDIVDTDEGAPGVTLGNITVSGTTGSAITDADVVVTIANDKLASEIAADTDLSSWITNLPEGLEAKAKTIAAAEATAVTIKISGIPTADSSEPIAVTVPSASLTGGADVTATENASAKFAITN